MIDSNIEALTVAEFCRLAKISKSLFYAEVNDGRICIIKRGRKTAAFPKGRKTLVPVSQLVRYVGAEAAQ